MSEIVQIFAFSFFVGLSGALLPGPLLAFTVHQAAKRGPHVGAWIVLGHGILESTLVVAIFVGVAGFLQSLTVLRVISVSGAAVMAFLGIMMLRDARKLSLSAVLKGEAPPSKIDNPVLGGALMSALNPTFPLWWATTGLALVAKYGTTVPNIIIFYAGHITSDLLWYYMMSNAIGRGRHLISDRAYKLFIAACALFLVSFAAYLAYCGFTGTGLASHAPVAAAIP